LVPKIIACITILSDKYAAALPDGFMEISISIIIKAEQRTPTTLEKGLLLIPNKARWEGIRATLCKTMAWRFCKQRY